MTSLPKFSSTTVQPPAAVAGSEDIDLSKIFRTLWRGKFFIAFCAFIMSAFGVYYAFVMATPTYTASSVVALESRQEQVVDLESVVSGLGGDQITINTEVEVLRSRGLLDKLAVQLDLVDDPEFNSTLQPPSKFSLGALIGYVTSFVATDTSPPPSLSDRAILDSIIDVLLAKISVINVRQSYVFAITAQTEDPEKSALIANTLAELYILDQLETKFEATEQATTWLTDRVSHLQVELEQAEAAAKDFNASTDLVSPEDLAQQNRQIKELRDRLGEAKETEVNARLRVKEIELAYDSQDLKQMAEAAADRTLTRIYTQIKDDPDADRTTFDARFQQVQERAELEQSRVSNQISALEATIVDQREQIRLQSIDLVELRQLEREAEASKLIYEYFLSRLKETSVQQGIQQADARILSQAVVPLGPSAPRKMIIVALSIIMGTFVGGSLVLLREFTQTTFRAAEDLESYTGYPVLGQIPAISARRRKNVLQYLVEKPTSAAAEAIRNMRTSVLLSNIDNPPQIIMSTSSIPGEGKTTQSLALSQNLSGLGKKVLLIEGDIRRRVFSEYFDIKERRGLISVLSGDRTLEETVAHEPTMNVDILIGEKSATNAADLYSSTRFREFMNEVRKKYDYIIIDTPPVLAVPDARVIGQSVDAILYTVRWDKTTHRQVSEGLKSFETVNVKVTGLVLGQINVKGMKQYGYGDSHGAYSAYYDN
ncbi:polysaccharide biosynthesis tyrosine autokinase [Tropicibacter sp. Alg240-R139]|uniref:GumC family protein n=1 Tax=Tropicibacter sp. Alg240-R139 TaxID=2305991 RepID=UPI0013E092AE|nr:polysaccharide biosynthesis tyrosine autokinase [Tropicibacter sp. Alg240-R139]